jgi:hypothetical protein
MKATENRQSRSIVGEFKCPKDALVNSQKRLALVIHELPVDATNLTTSEGVMSMKTTIVRFPTGILLIVISVLGLSWFSPAQAACVKQAVAPLAETVSGEVSLCQTSGDVIAKLQLKGLKPGNAYTVWLVYVDDGAKCSAEGQAACFGTTNTGGDQNAVPDEAFGRLTDVIAPKNGKANISGDVPGLQLSKGSQVWILVKGHGPASTSDNLARARQLLTPEDETAGAPNLGIVGGAVADFTSLNIFDN